MPIASASPAGTPSLATLGNLAYFHFPPSPRGGRSGPVVVGLAGPTETKALHALLLTCASHAEALAAAGGSRGMKPDRGLALPGATLLLDRRRRHPFLVELDPPLSGLAPADVLARLGASLSALGLYVADEPAFAAPPSGAASPPVRLSVLRSNAWRTSLFTCLDEALEAVSRVPEDRTALLTLVSEQASHRPRNGAFPDGARLASEGLLAAYAGVLAGTAGDGSGFAPFVLEAVSAQGAEPRAEPVPEPAPNGPVATDTVREPPGEPTSPVVPEAGMPREGGIRLDAERARVAARREALLKAIAEPPVAAQEAEREPPSPPEESARMRDFEPSDAAAETAHLVDPVVTQGKTLPETGAPVPWTILGAVADSIPALDPESASYVSRRLCLGKGPVPIALPETDRERRRITEAQAVEACRRLPWMPLLGKRIGRMRFEAPYPVDRVLAEPWAAGLGEQGLSFLMALALPGCHVAEVDRRPCVVPATERVWRDARDEALAALLSPHAPRERDALAEMAWHAMRDRSPELREAILVSLLPNGGDWYLRMKLELGGLGQAVADCLATAPGPMAAEAVRDRLAQASGTFFPIADVHRALAKAGVALADGRYLSRAAFPSPAETEALTRAAEAWVKARRGSFSCGEILSGLAGEGVEGPAVDPAVLDTLLRESGGLVDEGRGSWSSARPLPPAPPPRPVGRLPGLVEAVLSDGRERTHKEVLSSVSAMLGASPSRKAFAAALRRAAQGRVDKGKGGMVYGRREAR